MKTKSQRHHHCPSDTQFELLCLEVGLEEDERKLLQIHLQQCRTCRRQLETLDGFYSAFLNEVAKPISNQALDLAKEVGSKDVEYGLILCEPLPDLSNGHGFAYRAKVLFVANGVHGHRKLAQFDGKSIPKKSFAMRVMTDPDCKELLVFLLSSEGIKYEDWMITIPGMVDEKPLSRTGATSIPLADIRKFQDKVIFLKANADIAADVPEARFDRIKFSFSF